jgi:hypothetical protein
MNCNVHVFCKMMGSNKFGFILETVFSYNMLSVITLSVVMLNVGAPPFGCILISSFDITRLKLG